MKTVFKFDALQKPLALIGVFTLISLLIVLRSYYFEDGWITEDSSAYLSLAHNLVNGHGFYINHFPDIYQPAVTWPVLYSVLIAGVAGVTSLDVFWASKLTNILCLGLSFYILFRQYRGYSILFALLFLTSGYFRILTYTFSENIFIVGILIFSIGIARVFEDAKFQDFTWLFVGTLILFYSRWVGIFSIIFIGIVGLYLLLFKKDQRRFIGLLLVGLLSFAILSIQLYFNFKSVGYMTGTPRPFNQLGPVESIFMIFESYYKELNLIVKGSGGMLSYTVFLLFAGFTFIYFKRNLNKKVEVLPFNTVYTLEASFFWVGLFYLFMLTCIRMVSEFDNLHFRLLGPGTLLLYFALLGYLIKSGRMAFNKLCVYMLIVSLSSLFLETGYYLFRSNRLDKTYKQAIGEIVEYYKQVPPDSYVVCSNMYIRYIREDLFLVDVSKYDSWKEMVADFPPEKPLYVDSATLDKNYSIIILNQYGANEIITEEVKVNLPKNQIVKLN